MRYIFLSLAALVILGLGFVGYSSYLYRQPGDAPAKTVLIPPQTGALAILRQLHAEGLAPAWPLAAVPVFGSGAQGKLKAGEYAFEANATPAQVIGKIIRGEIVVHKVTVPEGWSSHQVREALMKEELLSGELPASIEEGSIFPDTVHYTRGEARGAVLARMQRKQQEVLMDLWPARAEGLPIQTPEEALILASVIEKETGIEAERGLVAGVFVNRLRQGMALQSDPTVAYGIMQGRPMERALSSADLKRDTAYNSYTRTGLPPTPICNPGRKAIEAALNPTPTDALFFVATGQGGHNFSTTVKEHNQNVSAYRKELRKRSAR